VATFFTNLPPIEENLHRSESRTQNAVGAARLFYLFHCQGYSRTRFGLPVTIDARCLEDRSIPNNRFRSFAANPSESAGYNFDPQ
jgi:hypothetical protein